MQSFDCGAPLLACITSCIVMTRCGAWACLLQRYMCLQRTVLSVQHRNPFLADTMLTLSYL